MDKHKIFFEKIGILNDADFTALTQYANVEVHLPSKNNILVTIEITINKPLPVDIFKKIYHATLRLSDQIKIILKSRIGDLEIDYVIEYIQFFIQIHNIQKICIDNILKRKAINITESGLLIFHYFNRVEMNELKDIEIPLLSFFKQSAIAITGIDYQLDQERQDLAIHKQKQLDKILINNIYSPSPKEIIIKKATDQNAIKEKNIDPINQLQIEDLTAVIQGEIFKVEKILSKKKAILIYKLSITDNQGAITITAFAQNTINNWNKSFLPSEYLDTFVKGDWIKAKISLSKDQFQNFELTGKVDKIIKITPPPKFIRVDEAEKKRIELLARTKMSSFDGMIDPFELIKRTKNYGWDAVGIADRYNVQSYPTLMQASTKLKQKVLYGYEFDMLDKQINIVANPQAMLLNNAQYIIFDIETTGLVNEFEDIIEFGAIKVKQNEIVDKIDFFIKPSKPLSVQITQLTNITNQHLVDAVGIKTGLKKIIDWIGNDVLIAHNGINFDLRFINKKLIQNGLAPLTNTLIDTMQLSRAVNKDLIQHSLGVIARSFHIDYDEAVAHRADFDAKILYQIWQIFMQKLHDLHIENINEINNKLQCDELYRRQFSSYAIAFAREQRSIKEIYRLVSKSSTKDLHRLPRVFKEDVEAKRFYFVLANSPTESDIWDCALNGSEAELKEKIKFYDYIFVAPSANLNHEIQRNLISKTNIEKTINKIIRIANDGNKKVIAVSDAYYLDIQDQVGHKIFVNSKILGGHRHRLFSWKADNSVLPDLHLRTTNEMLTEFKFLNDQKIIDDVVINNGYLLSNEIANNIQPLRSKLYSPKIDDVENKLTDVVYTNARKLYGSTLPPTVEQRIKHELKAIVDNNYSVIYWISHLLVEQSLRDGYLVGSRGSVGSSLVGYFANITEVNPLPPHYLCPHCTYSDFNVNTADGFDLSPKACPKCGTKMIGNGHNIPFETFLGFANQPKIPDIDLNFCSAYQSKAHKFVRNMFGETHTFRAGTISEIQDRTAFGYVKAYFETNETNSQHSQSEINWIVSKCVGVKRTTGQHPGGVIIVPKEQDILDFTPYNYPADDKSLGIYTTHFAFENLHDNLLKFDLLGHDDPTSLKMLSELTTIDVKTIPFKDENVIALFSSLASLKVTSNDLLGETTGAIGLPEFGTEFVRRMLTVAQPKSFADLIRVSGLSHGKDVWINNAVNYIIKAQMTLADVIACRDDVMIYLMQKGISSQIAFNIMEDVRRGRKVNPKYVKELLANKVPQWYIDSCNKITYLFPKAHATAYVIMSWRIAWFKYYYPLEFYATYFSVRTESFDIKSMLAGAEHIKNKLSSIRERLKNQKTKKDVTTKEINLAGLYEVAMEMCARGYSFANIDLNKSHATNFIITDDKKLLIPFSAIEGMGEKLALSIVVARQQAPFTSKEDLMNRTRISSKVLESFEEIGVTKHLNEDNQMRLF